MSSSSSFSSSPSSSARILPLDVTTASTSVENPFHAKAAADNSAPPPPPPPSPSTLELPSSLPSRQSSYFSADDDESPPPSSPPPIYCTLPRRACAALGRPCLDILTFLGRLLVEAAQRVLAWRLRLTLKYDTLATLATFYVLAVEVVRVGVPKAFDPLLDVGIIAALVVLALDLVMSSLARRCRYVFSFSFWVDLMVLISLVLDLFHVGHGDFYKQASHMTTLHATITMWLPILVGTLRNFRLFRVFDRHVVPIYQHSSLGAAVAAGGDGQPGSSSSSSASSALGPAVRLHPLMGGNHNNNNNKHTNKHNNMTSWFRGGGRGGGKDPHRGIFGFSFLPRPSISFVGDRLAYHERKVGRDVRSSGGGNSCSGGGANNNGGGGGGGGGALPKPLEAELYDLTMHRLILTIFATLLMLAFLNSNHAHHDGALDRATILLHQAQTQGGNETLTSLVLDSYLEYFDGSSGSGLNSSSGSGKKSILVSLQLNSPSAPFVLHDANRVAGLREEEIYRITLVSFYPPNVTIVPSDPHAIPPPQDDGLVHHEEAGIAADDEDGRRRRLLRQWRRGLQEQQQGGGDGDGDDDDILAYTAAIFDVSGAYHDRVLLEELILPLFLAALLLLAADSFSRDARRMIISPIDWIIHMVQKLAADPLGEIEVDVANDPLLRHSSEHAQYETSAIAASIKKITRLLRVGFGVAGADIITHNLDMNRPQAVLNPLLPGKRVMAIIGFCDIHQFDFIVKNLESEAMAFVNAVASIVHENAALWKGACNKNLGNSFLLIWRIGDEEKLLTVSRTLWSAGASGAGLAGGGGGGLGGNSSSSSGGGSSYVPTSHAAAAVSSNLTHLDVRRIPGVEALADQALIGFLKVLVALKRDKKIRSMCADPRLRQANGEDFQLNMRFGLHAGWAIEGAVGSGHKVDATYLSPHVNLAARMETAATQYGVPVLMTDTFYQILSSEARKRCRKLDVITVKGSATPKTIYTFDAHLGPLATLPSRSAFKTYSLDIWKKDKDILYLQEQAAGYQFRSTFQVGLTNYINGLWVQAAECFRACDAMMAHVGGDGPSRTLLLYMGGRGYRCPEDWQGFRPLTSK